MSITLAKLEYEVPDFIFEPIYDEFTLLSIIIRQIPLCSDSDSITFMIMALLFDAAFKEWFCSVYMHDMVLMMNDTVDLMFSEERLRKLKEQKERNGATRAQQLNALNDFAQALALRTIRSELRAERRHQQRREQQNEDYDSDDSDDEEDSDDEDIEIPDTEEVRMRIQLIAAQARHGMLMMMMMMMMMMMIIIIMLG